jgi:sugar/nucleoside kinase (ribokinase family)
MAKHPFSSRQTGEHQTLSIGGATYDLFIGVPAHCIADARGTEALVLPMGQKHRMTSIEGRTGGGANNTAVGLARLGCSAAFCGVIGDDQWGRELQHNFLQEQIDIRLATIVEGETSGCSLIVISPSGERTILTSSGTNVHLHDAVFDRRAAAEKDWIYLNHIQPQSCVIFDDLIAMLSQNGGPRLTWNPGGQQIEAGLQDIHNRALVAATELLLLNKEEALAFTNAKTPEGALNALLSLGAKHVCISDGPRGSIAGDGANRYFCPAMPVTVVDATGAGDAFGCGITWGLLCGLGLPSALRAGTINAASVVGTVGAQPGLLTEMQMRQRLSSSTLSVTAHPRL